MRTWPPDAYSGHVGLGAASLEKEKPAAGARDRIHADATVGLL